MAPKQSLDHVHEKIVVLGSGGVGMFFIRIV